MFRRPTEQAIFERFTDGTRKVVALTQEEARRLNHNYIGTEHILLGLIREGEGVAVKALMSLGISLEAVRQQVEEIIGQGLHAPRGEIPYTPRAKKVLEYSFREAKSLGQKHIDTEHILLGIVREGDGVAAQVLVKLGAGLNPVRQRVIQMMAHGYQSTASAAAGTLAQGPPETPEPAAPVGKIDASPSVSAGKHSVAAGRDVIVTAEDASVAAAVIHGNVELPRTQPLGPGGTLTGCPLPGQLGPGAVVAVHGGVAFGTYNAAPRPEVARLPVSLPPRTEVLAGREGLLAELDTLLTGGAQPRTVVLAGLGGTGKTSLAAEYARRHLAEVGVAWRIQSANPAALAAGMEELAAQLGDRDLADPRDPVASVHAVLAAYPSEWLLIFDDAQDEASLDRFVPPAGRGRVLITSQNQHWPGKPVLDVPVLDPDAASRFLVNRTGELDHPAALELATEVGGLPLALEQAAAYIQATGTRLAGYLTLLRHRRMELLTRGGISGPLATTAGILRLALSQLEAETPAAAGLLRLLACLAPEPVPLPLLLSDAGTVGELEPEVAVALRPLLGDPLAASDAIADLRRYSLVTLTSESIVQVHQLVQAVTVDQMAASQAAWRRAAAMMIEQAIPADTDLPDSWRACALLLPHAQTALALETPGIQRMANYLGMSGSFAVARDLQHNIADARARVFGPSHPDTLTARASLAKWTGEAGDAVAARDQYAALLPILEEVRGAGHLDTNLARVGVAHWAVQAGDRDALRDMFGGSPSIQEDTPDTANMIAAMVSALAAEDPDAISASIANIVPVFQDATAARDFLKLALTVYAAFSDITDPMFLQCCTLLADLNGMAEEPLVARDQFAALLPVVKKTLGTEHPQTLTARSRHAFWTGKAGDPVRARDLYAAVAPVQEKVLGTEHPDTLITRINHAFYAGEAGDAVKARDQFAALVPVCEKVLGAEHPDTLNSRAHYANWTQKAGDPAAARDL